MTETKPDPEWEKLSTAASEERTAMERLVGSQKERQVLLERVILGNNRLMAGWVAVNKITDSIQFEEQSDRLAASVKKLRGLCTVLTMEYKYEDCLYMVDGIKTRHCLNAPDGAFCWVCPAKRHYWLEERQKQGSMFAVKPVTINPETQDLIDTYWPPAPNLSDGIAVHKHDNVPLEGKVGDPIPEMTKEQAAKIVESAAGSRPDLPSGKDYVDEVRNHKGGKSEQAPRLF